MDCKAAAYAGIYDEVGEGATGYRGASDAESIAGKENKQYAGADSSGRAVLRPAECPYDAV